MVFHLLFLTSFVLDASALSGRSLKIETGQVVNFDPRELFNLPRNFSLRFHPQNSDIGEIRPKSSNGQNLTYSHFGSDYGQILNFFIFHDDVIEKGSIEVLVEKRLLFKPIVVENGKSVAFKENLNTVRPCTAFIKETPRFGALRLRFPGQLEYKCDNLNNSFVYKHFDKSQNDSLTLRIKLEKPHEIFYTKIEIYVKSNKTNLPPEIIEKGNFFKLKSKDDNTKMSNLVYRVENPKEFEVLSTFSGLKLDFFYQEDIDKKSVTVLPIKNGTSALKLKVYDEEGASTLTEIRFSVVNSTKFRLLSKASEGLTVFEKDESPILNFPTVGDDQNLNIRLVQKPKFGNLSKNVFTLLELIKGQITYKNFEKGTDLLIFDIETVGIFYYPIFILKCDKSPPVWFGPKEITFKNNEIFIPFSSFDSDSNQDELGYRINEIKYGEIILKVDGGVKVVREWTQKDVFEKRVQYRLAKRPVGGGVDLFKFFIFDSAFPPNETPVSIEIYIPKDVTAPRLVGNPGLIYREDPTKLSGLRYADAWPPSHLFYHPISSLNGHFATKSGLVLPLFTQEMIDKGVVFYRLLDKNVADFEILFNVTDGDGNKLENQVLKVHVLKETLLLTHQSEYIALLRLDEGGIAELSSDIMGHECSSDSVFEVVEKPKKGQIVNGDTSVASFNCTSLQLGDVYYEHDSDETGANKIFDRFVLKTGTTTITMNVIIDPIDDLPTNFHVKNHLVVDEGSKVQLTQHVLEINDEDTHDENIKCDIVQKPIYGTISNFKKSDLIKGNVIYTQSVHEKVEPEKDHFKIFCHDANTEVENQTIDILINRINDEPPIITYTNITKKYTQLSQIVYITDLDTPSESLTLGIIKHPRKGIIEKKFGNLLNFTMSELKEVFYENFGGADSFVLAVSDGDFYTASEIFVKIENFNPLITNKGLELDINQNKVISNKELYSEINNFDDKDIKYVLKNPPMFGTLYKNDKEMSINDVFSQEDLNKNYISYVHNDPTSLMDVFVFDIECGEVMKNQNFFITIHDDRNFRVYSSKANVLSKSILTLGDDILWVEPRPADKKKVTFHLVSPAKLGRLEYVDGTAANAFSMEDLEKKLIRYVHKVDMSQEILQFEVNNGVRRVFHSMVITVEKTKTFTNLRKLPEGNLGCEITFDSPPSTRYEITKHPENGIVFNTNVNQQVKIFTQDDLDRKFVFYYLQNNNTTSDSIVLDLTSNEERLKNVILKFEFSKISFKSNVYVTKEDNEDFQVDFVRHGFLSEQSSLELIIKGGNATSDDYILHSSMVYFTPGQTESYLKMKIENDDIFEGVEFISLKIESDDSIVGEPSECQIFISDYEKVGFLAESPTFKRKINDQLECKNKTILKFEKNIYKVEEKDEYVNIEVIRDGENTISVLCYTEDNSANHDDYELLSSNIIFHTGETRKNCTIKLKNDENHEGDEDFNVFLKCPGEKDKISTTVIISDEEDEEIIEFEKEQYFVQESNQTLKIAVVRKGDSSYGRHVKIFTENGTAKSGQDFKSLPTVLAFEPKSKISYYEVDILSDKVVEGREFFVVNLSEGKTKKNQQTIVYIIDATNARAIMFPGPPIVQSLRDYGTTKIDVLIQGYPIVCVSVCNSNHPKYQKDWCIENNVTEEFHWQIEDLSGDLKEIRSFLFFSPANKMVLDSVYFRGGFKLRCGVRPIVDEYKGKISYSSVVTIDENEGVCSLGNANILGAEPFTSHISYMDLNETKTLRITVNIPHFDGLFPVVTTKKMKSEREILSNYPMKAEIHKCSNILETNEVATKNGFDNPSASLWKKFEPNQLDRIRGNETLRFYKYLNLKGCLWNFEGFFTLSEVVNLCGATVRSDSNMENEEASVLLELPLHIYYFTTSLLGWQQIHSTTTMKLEFTYKTSTIIKGDMMKMDEEKPKSYLLGTNMFISPNGSLVVHFKTKPKFFGYFLSEIPGKYKNYVRNEKRPELGFTLVLLANLTEGPSVEQSWMFSSDMASVDYSGNYEISLIPCVSSSVNSKCVAKEPIVQYLQVNFQQISDPVLHKYSLDTEFKLKKKRGAEDELNDEDASIFEPGDYVYGKIKVTPPQDHLSLNIKKCYICAGKSDYTPKYNPQNREYGCLMDSPNLYYSLKLIDKDDVNSVQREFFDQDFNATLISDDCGDVYQKSKNCDSFMFNATPLFKQPLAKIWFVHCTYSITIPSKKRIKRNPNEILENGSNIHRIVLREREKSQRLFFDPIRNWYLVSLSSFLAVLFVFSGFLLMFVIGIKRELKETKNQKFSYVSYNTCKSDI